MAISSQELSELKSRVLVAIRTRSNIARVSDYLISLIREAGSYLPERPKTDTDTEYLYLVILAIESKRKHQGSQQVTENPEPTLVEDLAPIIQEPIEVAEPVVEPSSEITLIEEVDHPEIQETEESVSEHTESPSKLKSGKQAKKSKK